MTRDEALAKLRHALARLPFDARRITAYEAFDRLVHELEAPEDLIKQAHDDLVAVLPECEAAVDRILAVRIVPRGAA